MKKKNLLFTKVLFAVLMTIMVLGVNKQTAMAEEVFNEETSDETENHVHTTYEEVIKKATTSKNGSVKMQCTYCGEIDTTAGYTIYKIETVELPKTSYTYTGKRIKPSVTVKDSEGNVIDSTNYKVSYENNLSSGTATVTVKFKGSYYSGKVQKNFTIKPKKLTKPETTSITSIKTMKNGFALKWEKQSKGVDGYQIQYSKTSDFKNAKSILVESKNATKFARTGLAKNTKYYVRIRTYKNGVEKVDTGWYTLDGKKIYKNEIKNVCYSKWSTKKSVTTKTSSTGFNSTECPYPLYTLIDEGGDKMYFYTPYGGDGIIDEDKFDTLADQICEKISSLHQDESHGRAGIYWTPVGTYNGTTYVQRYGGSLQLDNGEYLIRDNGTESFHILTTD